MAYGPYFADRYRREEVKRRALGSEAEPYEELGEAREKALSEDYRVREAMGRSKWREGIAEKRLALGERRLDIAEEEFEAKKAGATMTGATTLGSTLGTAVGMAAPAFYGTPAAATLVAGMPAMALGPIGLGAGLLFGGVMAAAKK